MERPNRRVPNFDFYPFAKTMARQRRQDIFENILKLEDVSALFQIFLGTDILQFYVLHPIPCLRRDPVTLGASPESATGGRECGPFLLPPKGHIYPPNLFVSRFGL